MEDHRYEDATHQQIELYSRLIAVVLQHWAILATGWSKVQLSLVKAARRIRESVPQIVAALEDLSALESVLESLVVRVTRCVLDPRRQHPNTYQTLEKLA